MRRFAAAALLLAGCHSGGGEQPRARAPAASSPVGAVPTGTAPPPAAVASATPPVTVVPPPVFVVRSACDDKYDADATCRPGKAAWDAWLQGIDLSAVAANLLNHQGGGPGGAEWNPAAPLVVFVASRTEAGSARLKSSRATLKPAARFDIYDVFLVPVAGWSAAARRPRAADFPEGTALQPLSVVELHALADDIAQRGIFVFSRGE